MTETRADKAQRLVDEGGVEIVRIAPYATTAFVQGDHGLHAVILFASGNFNCVCPWGKIHWNSKDLCAHALAVQIVAEKENKPC